MAKSPFFRVCLSIVCLLVIARPSSADDVDFNTLPYAYGAADVRTNLSLGTAVATENPTAGTDVTIVCIVKNESATDSIGVQLGHISLRITDQFGRDAKYERALLEFGRTSPIGRNLAPGETLHSIAGFQVERGGNYIVYASEELKSLDNVTVLPSVQARPLHIFVSPRM